MTNADNHKIIRLLKIQKELEITKNKINEILEKNHKNKLFLDNYPPVYIWGILAREERLWNIVHRLKVKQ